MVMVPTTTWDYDAPPVGVVTVWDVSPTRASGDTPTEWDEINDAKAGILYNTVRTRDRTIYLAKLPGPVKWPISSNY